MYVLLLCFIIFVFGFYGPELIVCSIKALDNNAEGPAMCNQGAMKGQLLWLPLANV